MKTILTIFALLTLTSCFTSVPEKELSEMKSPVRVVAIHIAGTSGGDIVTVVDSLGTIRTYNNMFATSVCRSRQIGDTLK